ncbi:MAG: tRNA 2-selenouridine(34) synthase MnmH [Bacillota bacterium]|nr:tRNA 2-selenouridine(34) synthase MnmH [Bacillota bacterium]
MEITIEKALERTDLQFIDVRSPHEFREASIPGSLNVPLFDDAEHSRLGLLFREKGEIAARRAGLQIAAPKLPHLVEQISGACKGKIPLLYCQRGGLRSLSLYQILNLCGITVFRLQNGYRGFRQYVVKRLKDYHLQSRLIVLHGLTGAGKTAVLKVLEEEGVPVIDLEGLAGHRGSVFGAVGLPEQQTQKEFDALLLQELDRRRENPWIVVEGEGKRIGRVSLPPFLVEALDEGFKILLTASLETRVRRIVDSYIPAEPSPELLNQLKEAVNALRRRLGNKKVDFLLAELDRKNFDRVATSMCVDYYDHLYSDSRPECARFDEQINAEDINTAAGQIQSLLKNAETATIHPGTGPNNRVGYNI